MSRLHEEGLTPPVIRLAATCALMEESNREHSEARYPFHKARMEAPTLRLAHVPGAQGDNCLMGRNNSKAMWKAGIPAIPTFHRHEPWDALKGYAADYPKIAVGGMADLRATAKREYAEQCFARVW